MSNMEFFRGNSRICRFHDDLTQMRPSSANAIAAESAWKYSAASLVIAS